MGRKGDADTVHIVLLAEHEADAKANDYLAGAHDAGDGGQGG